MTEVHVAVFVGSLRRDSLNRKLATALMRMAPQGFSFTLATIHDLPLYDQDDDEYPADAVRMLKAQVASAQALLFVTPEYNRSIPGVLKNALDHGSRPAGHNSWAGKPAGVLGVSVGATGTALAQQHLRNILAYLDVPVMAQPEAFIRAKDGLFNSSGQIGDEGREFLQKWMDHYVTWVQHFLT